MAFLQYLYWWQTVFGPVASLTQTSVLTALVQHSLYDSLKCNVLISPGPKWVRPQCAAGVHPTPPSPDVRPTADNNFQELIFSFFACLGLVQASSCSVLCVPLKAVCWQSTDSTDRKSIQSHLSRRSLNSYLDISTARGGWKNTGPSVSHTSPPVLEAYLSIRNPRKVHRVGWLFSSVSWSSEEVSSITAEVTAEFPQRPNHIFTAFTH